VRRVAEEAGLVTVADAPQSSFLLEAALLSGIMQSLGTSDRLRDRLALKTLLVPEGFGGNFRVVVFSRRPDGRIDRTRNQAPVRLAR
jgi:SAM-dependent MidA family methyltransferase